MDSTLANLDDVLPHRRRMRLVDALERADAQGGVVRLEVREGAACLSHEGHLKPTWCVEVIAQAVACYVGWTWIGRPDRPGTFGYVVAVDDCSVDVNACARVRPGDSLRVEVRKEFEMPLAGVYSGVLRLGSETLGRTSLKVIIESDLGFIGEVRHGAQASSGHGR
jgi:predicted hotdog family 3-hydroxylacyl-ACP dehydratase